MSASTEPRPPSLPVIVRPNGKPYRPRKIVAHRWDTDSVSEFGCGVVVLGTHDVERARALAVDACNAWHGMEYANTPQVGWFRLGYSRRGERAWIEDVVRGAAGVIFTASDEPEVSEG